MPGLPGEAAAGVIGHIPRPQLTVEGGGGCQHQTFEPHLTWKSTGKVIEFKEEESFV